MNCKNLLDCEISEEKLSENGKGLSSRQAEERLTKYGKNVLASSKKAKPLKIFLGQFRDVMVMILLAATVISFLLGETADGITIVVIVTINAVLGFVQEYRTEKTLLALANMTAPNAKVYRDGHLVTLPSSEIVPDDVILVEAGDKVPADAVIIKARDLCADESVLTGESLPAAKKEGDTTDSDNRIGRQDVIYSGTMITKGSAEARVIATGTSAQMGKISGMLTDIEQEETPLQKRLAELGKIVAIICIAVCIIVAGAGILRGEPVFDMLMTGITIAIAAIPEGLPATVTIALALAVSRMLKRNALVHKLHSVETLGCTSVICTDKTGTVTENKMTVTEVYCGGELYSVSGTGNRRDGKIFPKKSDSGEIVPYRKNKDKSSELAEISYSDCGEDFTLLLNGMILCENADIYAEKVPGKYSSEWQTSGDPTETALLIAAAKSGADIGRLRSENLRTDEIPFESETRCMSVICRNGSNRTIYSKGACDVILNRCRFVNIKGNIMDLTHELKKEISDECGRMSAAGLRVLAFSYKKGGGSDKEQMIFLGLCGMTDPPRPEAKRAVRLCRNAHIKTVMITGDHKETAAAVAREAGILRGGMVVGGDELARMSDEKLDDIIDKVSVFARVTPADKLRIVQAFKRRGGIVTMTGDGVNDAPAVKEADIGVAMGITGTDVTRQAADMVLLDDNFATLVSAVEQGRGIYANIRKFVRYLLSCNIGEVLTMFLGIVMGMPMVLLPAQILLVNLVTDGLPAVALGVEPADPDCMKAPPRKKNESFFSGGLMSKIIFRGIFIGLCTLGSFTAALNMGAGIQTARTSALLTLVMSQLLHVFECKSEKKNIFTVPYFNNPKLIGAVLISAAVIFASIYFQPLQIIFSTAALNSTQLLWALGFAAAAPLLQAIVSQTGK
ncbi:MAG: cation-translocating P-type ATPase [Oscillospiraceae bacterium]|nr:cation-translocating P-type ATPase [Oscillospiraceae bacterium]